MIPAYSPSDRGARVRARTAVFALTWIAYASYYLGRKGWAVSKRRLEADLGLGATGLAYVDTAYLAAYCGGQFLAGAAGDRLGPKRLIGFGMLLAATSCAAAGSAAGAIAFGAAFAANGLFQATGWPGTVKAMARVFGPAERGAVMGIWSTCYQVGGLAATALATFLLVRSGWRATFILPALFVAAVGLAVLVALPEGGVPPADRGPGPTTGAGSARALLRSRAIWTLGTAYFCLKLIRYSLLFWLPYYLGTALGYSDASAGYQSISFEAGGIAGSIAVGLASDRLFARRRREVAAVMVLALGGALFLYTRLAALSPAANFAGMALVGFCLFGPDTLISGAAAQDLGGRGRVATAAGVINGMGSLGAIFQGRLTSGVSTAYGWNALFLFFVALSVVAAVVLVAGRPPERLQTLDP